MIALDTNILVRFLTADDPVQSARARALLLRDREYFVAVTVLLELGWVLQSMGWERAQLAPCLRALLALDNVRTQHPEAMALALGWFEQGLDLADALHLALSATATEFVTFDTRLQKKAAALRLSPAVAVLKSAA